MTTTRRTALAAIGAAIASPYIARPAKAADFAWKFGHGFAANHPLQIRATEAAAKIRRDTNGRVDISVLPASQLGGDSDLLAQVRSGGIEFFSTGGLIFATLVPVAAIGGMGFAFKDYPTVWKAMDGDLGAFIRKAFDKVGLHAFEKIWDNGFRQITTSSRVVKGPADLKNLKLRVPVSQVYVSLFKALEAAPTSLNLSEVYTALQTGVVDGQENPLIVTNTSKFYEVQKYCALSNHVWDGSWIVGNGRSWKAAPEDVRTVVSRHFNEAAALQRQDIADQNESLKTSLEKGGLRFNTCDPAPFREALKKAGFYADWKAKFGADAWSLLEASVGSLT